MNFEGLMPYFVVFAILLVCGMGVPFPEDITLLAGGYLAYEGKAALIPMILVGLSGVLIGDVFVYWIGYHFGPQLTKRWFFAKLLPDHRIEAVRAKLTGPRGNFFLFAARFMPGLRAPVYFSSGTLRIPFRRFFLLDALAAVMSVPLIVYVAYAFGDVLDDVVAKVKKVEGGIVLVVLLIVAVIAGKWYISHRRLRMARAKNPVSPHGLN